MRRAAALCALLLLAGCTHLPWRVRAIPVPLEQADPALARLQRGVRQRDSLRAMGRLELEGPGVDPGRVEEIVLAQRPDRLRLEALSPLGQALSFLVTDGQRYAYYDGKSLESGAVSADTLRERMGLALELREAVEVLLAAPPSAAAPAQSAFRRGEELWVVQAGWRLGFAPDGELAAFEALDARGALRWRARYSGWRDVPGGRYPQALSLEFPGARVQAHLELSRVELNPALLAEPFRPPEPQP